MDSGGADHVERARHQHRVVGAGLGQRRVTRLVDRRHDEHVLAAHVAGSRGDIGGGQAAARRRRAADDEIGLVGSQRREHLARIASLQEADDEDALAGWVEVVVHHLSASVGPGWVVGAVDDHQRLVAEDFEPTGPTHGGEALFDDLPIKRGVEELLNCGQRAGCVVTLMATMEGQEKIDVRRLRRADVQLPAAQRELVLDALEIDLALDDMCRAGGAEDGGQRRVGLAEDERRVGLDDPGLLGGNMRQRRAGELEVVHADVGDDGDAGIGDVRRVPSPEQADFEDDDIDGDIGEPAERASGDDVEVARLDAGDERQIDDGGDLLGQVLVGDRFVVATDPFVDALEVRAGERPDRQTVSDEQLRDDLRGRTLAVRAGDVDDRRGVLRITHCFDEPADALEARMFDATGLVIAGMGVEVSQRVSDVHRGERPRVVVPGGAIATPDEGGIKKRRGVAGG